MSRPRYRGCGKTGRPDIIVADHGSVAMVRPASRAGKIWLRENVQIEPWQWLGDSFSCEPRMVFPLVDGARDAGLVIVGEP